MLRLRQLALAATQRDPVIEELRAFLAVPLGYIDPGVGAFGLENRLLVVGDDHLEVVSPVEENTTAGRWIDRQGGDAGYMVIFQCDNLVARREHFADLGVRTVWTSDRPEAIASHLHPKDVGGAIVSIDQMPSWDGWHWAGPSWTEQRDAGWAAGFAAARLASPTPETLAARWSAVLETPLTEYEGLPCLALDGNRILFEAGPREALMGIDLKVRAGHDAPAPTTIAGVRFQGIADA